MLLKSIPDDFKLNAQNSDMNLHALPDDFRLTSLWGTQVRSAVALSIFYLTDVDGNRLTDVSGNPLVAYDFVNVQALGLHALPDDFSLNAE